MNKIPRTTLFMIQSVDGKISSGDTDAVDVDRDWKRIVGVKEGLPQYYALEKRTDHVSFNTGRVMAKIGINTRTTIPPKLPRLFFVLVDNKPHLNQQGLRYLSGWLGHVFIVTTNKKHPAFALQKEVANITVLLYPKQINFRHLFETLYSTYKFKRVTIQSGGTMNTKLVREGIIDRISLVIAPLLVGGATTPTIMEGEAIHQVSQLALLKPLKLVSVKKLRDSYVHLVYKVLPKTVIK